MLENRVAEIYKHQTQRCKPKKIKIRDITNFTFIDPKKKRLFKLELCHFCGSKHFPQKTPKITHNMSKKCIL